MFMNYMQGGGVVQGGFWESEAPPPPNSKIFSFGPWIAYAMCQYKAHSKYFVIIATGKS